MGYRRVYLPAMVFGLVAMGPSAVFGEKYGKGREVFMVSVATILFGFLAMGFASKPWIFIVGVVLFFIGFNMFEPVLQSFVSKFAKVHQKGGLHWEWANTFWPITWELFCRLGNLLQGYYSWNHF